MNALVTLGCAGKEAYATHAGAHVAMKRIERRHRLIADKGRVLTTYRCKHCHQWHLGHELRS